MITRHVYYVESSHKDSKVKDEFINWLKKTYASDNIGKEKAKWVTIHNYLTMKLDYWTLRVFMVDITDKAKSMSEDFHQKLDSKIKLDW